MSKELLELLLFMLGEVSQDDKLQALVQVSYLVLVQELHLLSIISLAGLVGGEDL